MSSSFFSLSDWKQYFIRTTTIVNINIVILCIDIYRGEDLNDVLPAERLLPRVMAERWRHLPLPQWVAECCGLLPGSSVGDLASVLRPAEATARAAVDFFVCELVKERAHELADARIFPPNALEDGVAVAAAQWPGRARIALSEAGLINAPEDLKTLTYGQLLRLKGVGVKAAIQLGLHAEHLPSGPESGDSPQSNPATTEPVDDATLESLRALAAADWADLVDGSDPRFTKLVPNDGRSLADLAEALVLTFAPTGDASSQIRLPYGTPGHLETPLAVQDWLREVQNTVSRLEALHLEDLLSDFLTRCSTLSGKRRDALLARLGWSGERPLTLEDTGRRLDLTRERIRQIENRVRRNLPPTRAYFPALSKALQVLVEIAPVEVDKAAAVLQTRGVSNAKFSPESVIAAANDLGIDPPVRIATAKGVRFVTRAANTAHVSAILVLARKKAGASGVVSAHDVAASVSRTSALECSVEDVTSTLDASPRFRHLRDSWYWATDLPARRNRLINVCTNMLSVVSPISITRLREGIKREYMFRNYSSPGSFDLRVPPADVLRDFLRDHPDFVADEVDGVRPIKPLDYRKQLGQADQLLVDVLRSSPGALLDRATIIRECVERGLNPATVNVSLTYSCLIEHIDTNIWTLRGSDVNPATVEALRRSNALRPRERRVRDFGWTVDGCLWIAAVVPPITQPFVFGCPVGCRSYLVGQAFSAVMRDSTPCGNVRITDDGMAYGFNAFQQVSGCDSGDIVVVEFNLSDRVATLMLGDEELLDRYTS